MLIEIKHRYTDNVICSFDVTTVKEAVEKAVKQGADMRGVNLRGADMRGVNLRGANLRGADMYGADMRGADVRGADMSSANLRGADVRGADMSSANLYGADMYGVNMSSADLYGADMYGVNLRGADMRGVNLRGADMRGANLRGADMRGVNLYGANMYGADVRGADMSSANMYGADMYGVKNLELVIAQQSIVPEGQIIVWKKLENGVIAKLSIPGNAKRVNAIGSRKCRASIAFVLELSDGSQSGFDVHTGKLEYKVGEFVTPDSFDDSIYKECSNGIHFFLTRTEAENY